MGGRGASSGISVKGKKYGTEYQTVLSAGNIKFIRQTDNASVKAPMETMSRGRIYVTLAKSGDLAHITYYDRKFKRMAQIDLIKPHRGLLPHLHQGYEHAEYGTRSLTKREHKIVEKVRNIWDNYNSKKK